MILKLIKDIYRKLKLKNVNIILVSITKGLVIKNNIQLIEFKIGH